MYRCLEREQFIQIKIETVKYRENSHVGMNAKLHWYNDELNKTKIQVSRLKRYKDWCM